MTTGQQTPPTMMACESCRFRRHDGTCAYRQRREVYHATHGDWCIEYRHRNPVGVVSPMTLKAP